MIIFDTETTNLLMPEVADLTTQPHMIEIAMARLTEGTFELVEEYQTLINPNELLDEEAHKKITGLTNADLKGQPIFVEVYGALASFCLGEEKIISHNLAFDMGVLVAELRRIGKEFAFPYPPKQICTVNLSKHIKGRRLKLTELYELKVGKPLAQTHRAMDDVRALTEIVRKLKP